MRQSGRVGVGRQPDQVAAGRSAHRGGDQLHGHDGAGGQITAITSRAFSALNPAIAMR
jgi:hypothetical protein